MPTLLIRDAELVVTMVGQEIKGGWVAVRDGDRAFRGTGFAGAHSDPVEALIRCGPASARHTIVDGKFVVRDGMIVHARLQEMLERHRSISRAWHTTD